ncbi:unnamed protein product [Sphagnum balticum]
MASWTCRKWRLALRHHLHTLRLTGISKTEEFEFLLTNTILQTTSLQNLHISHNNRFAAVAVIAWLLHTGDSLRHLTYHVPESTLHVNVLERCARMKHLQSLDFSPSLTGYAFAASATAQWFPCLLSLTLSFIKVSASQLKSLVSACQMLESFSLSSAIVTSTDAHGTLHLTSSSLKSVKLENMHLGSVILEAYLLESLFLRRSTFSSLKLDNGGTGFRILSIEHVDTEYFDIGQSYTGCCLYLEEVQVKEAGNPVWAAIDSFLANPSAKLRNLQLMGIPMFPPPVNLNLDRIACLFPCLDHLSLGYTMVEDSLPVETQFGGCTVLEKVRFLELWFPQPILDYTIVILMGETLKRCPNLRKLQLTSLHDSIFRSEFMTSFVKLVLQFSHVHIQFA